MVTLCSELFLGTFFIALLYERVVFQLPDRISLYTDTPRLRQHYVLEDLVQVGTEYTCGQLYIYVCHC